MKIFGRLRAGDVLLHVCGRQIQPRRGVAGVEIHGLLKIHGRFAVLGVLEDLNAPVQPAPRVVRRLRVLCRQGAHRTT
jgi:hypothetical protein